MIKWYLFGSLSPENRWMVRDCVFFHVLCITQFGLPDTRHSCHLLEAVPLSVGAVSSPRILPWHGLVLLEETDRGFKFSINLVLLRLSVQCLPYWTACIHTLPRFQFPNNQIQMEKNLYKFFCMLIHFIHQVEDYTSKNLPHPLGTIISICWKFLFLQIWLRKTEAMKLFALVVFSVLPATFAVVGKPG